MKRSHVVQSAAVALGLLTLTAGVLAQQAPAGRGTAPPPQGQAQGTCRAGVPGTCGTPPALMFRETWKMPPYTGELNDEKRRATEAVVTNPQLELKLYGPNARDVLAYEYHASAAGEGAFGLWTGVSAPVAITLRDKNNYADLSGPPRGGPGSSRGGLARMRAIVRTESLHVLYPVVKLADGTYLAGDNPVRTNGDFLQVEISFNDLRWFRLNPEKVVTLGEVVNPDLTRIDEVGFVDMMTSAGHGLGGWSNISTIELYANPVKR